MQQTAVVLVDAGVDVLPEWLFIIMTIIIIIAAFVVVAVPGMNIIAADITDFEL